MAKSLADLEAMLPLLFFRNDDPSTTVRLMHGYRYIYTKIFLHYLIIAPIIYYRTLYLYELICMPQVKRDAGMSSEWNREMRYKLADIAHAWNVVFWPLVFDMQCAIRAQSRIYTNPSWPFFARAKAAGWTAMMAARVDYIQF